jgi:hypothetical protein
MLGQTCAVEGADQITVRILGQHPLRENRLAPDPIYSLKGERRFYSSSDEPGCKEDNTPRYVQVWGWIKVESPTPRPQSYYLLFERSRDHESERRRLGRKPVSFDRDSDDEVDFFWITKRINVTEGGKLYFTASVKEGEDYVIKDQWVVDIKLDIIGKEECGKHEDNQQ